MEISGYDCFQGVQKDVIIITALKPHDGFELLNTEENLIVALTRATDSVIFCGNFQHVLLNHGHPLRSTWEEFTTDAKVRKRFCDLDGEFNEALIKKTLIPHKK